MKLLLISVAVLATAFFMGTRRHPAISLLGQGLLVLIILVLGAGILFCIGYPLFFSRDSGALMLGAIPLLFFGLIPWGLLMVIQDIIRARRMLPEEREKQPFGKEWMAEIDAEMEEEMKDTGYVKGSMLSTADRQKEREKWKRSRFHLALIKMMKDEKNKSDF